VYTLGDEHLQLGLACQGDVCQGVLHRAYSLLDSCVQTKDPTHRLGGKLGAEEIQSHPFFQDVSWGLLRNQRPPFKSSGSPRDSSLSSDPEVPSGGQTLGYNY